MKVQVVIFALIVAGVLTRGCKFSMNVPTYKQCDPKWGSNQLGDSSTICKSGSQMCSVASALASLGKTIKGQTATPATLNDFVKPYDNPENFFLWGSVSIFGVSFKGEPTSTTDIKKYICTNSIVILNVNNGGHWVLATGYDDAIGYSVMDPGYSKRTYGFSEVQRAAVFSW